MTTGDGLFESDKKPDEPADAGAPDPVPSEQEGGLTDDEAYQIALDSAPFADGVKSERADKWAIYDKVALRYVPGSVRARPPTRKMVAGLADLNAESGDRFELRRV